MLHACDGRSFLSCSGDVGIAVIVLVQETDAPKVGDTRLTQARPRLTALSHATPLPGPAGPFSSVYPTLPRYFLLTWTQTLQG